MTYKFKNARLEEIYHRRQLAEPSQPPLEPQMPLEEAWKPTTWKWILSADNIDLLIIAGIYVVALALALAAIDIGARSKALGATAAFQLIFSAAVFGTFVELLRRLQDTAAKRLAIIGLFTSEMLSVLRIFAAANIMGHFVRLYDRIGDVQLAAAPDDKNSALPSGFADTARSENYFSTFDNNSADLGLLKPSVVNDITAFYTFFRASRDATGALKLWKEDYYTPAMKRDDIVAIIYLCFLMSVHGRRALGHIVIPENRAIVDDIFAGVLLQCFAFLDFALAAEDFRKQRLNDRRASCADLQMQYRYEIGPLDREEMRERERFEE